MQVPVSSNTTQLLLMSLFHLYLTGQYVLCEKDLLLDIHKLTCYFKETPNLFIKELGQRYTFQAFLQLIIIVIINRICITIC